MGSKLLSKKIISAGNDIFYIDDFNIDLPTSINIGNKKYYRFCDFILIPSATELLSSDQVKIVNHIRALYYEIHPQFKKNIIVREKFKSLIEILKPNSILEFGPGSNPFIPKNAENVQLQYVDFSSESVALLNSLKLNCYLFEKESPLMIKDNSIDIVISIFVFQFDISRNQISELYRVLKENGIILANIYLRSAKSRKILLNEFHSLGFFSIQIPDILDICVDHEYWVFYKALENEKINLLLDYFN